MTDPYPLFSGANGSPPPPPAPADPIPPRPEPVPQPPAEPPPPPAAATDGAAPSYDEKTVCLSLTLSRWGITRAASLAAVQTPTDKALLHLSKRLIDCPEYKAIQREDNRVSRRLTQLYALPSMFRAGVYRLPVALVPEVDALIRGYAETTRPALVNEFLAVYPAALEEASRRLGPEFNPEQYPDVDRLRRAFGCEWSYLTLETPGKLASISAALYEREAAKAAENLRAGVEEINQVLALQLSELCASISERLTPDESGKKKIFRDSLVTNLSDFLRTIDARNVTGNQQLSDLTKTARELLRGVSPDRLRQSQFQRERLQEGFAEIKSQLDSMLTDAPLRAFDMTPDD